MLTEFHDIGQGGISASFVTIVTDGFRHKWRIEYN